MPAVKSFPLSHSAERRFRVCVKALLLAVLFPLGIGMAHAERYELTTGEVIDGTVVSQAEGCVGILTPYGTLQIPVEKFKAPLVGAVAKAEISAQDSADGAASPEVAQTAASSAAAAAESEKQAAINSEAEILANMAPGTPIVESEPGAGGNLTPAEQAAHAEAQAKLETEVNDWTDAYKAFVSRWIPNGWRFKINPSLDLKETKSFKTTLKLSASAHRDWDLSSLDLNVFYEYTTESYDNGNSNVTTDKYGGAGTYRYFFSDKKDWYIIDTLAYKTDRVKKIWNQCDEFLGGGYNFKFSKIGLDFSLAVGPALRYINAAGYDKNWVPMAALSQELKWQISKTVRLEEKGYMGAGISDPEKDNFAYLMVGLVYSPSDVLNIALRYTYEYDGINGPANIKMEERLIFGIEIPLGW